MWKAYSRSYIARNRASSVSVMAAALLATLFLSLLCSLSYNFWRYDVEQIELDEGDWQARVTGKLDEDDAQAIRRFANVTRAQIGVASPDGQTVIDVYFARLSGAYRDMPLIAHSLGLTEDAIEYHTLLLSRYFVHDPNDSEPPLLLSFYAAILLLVCVSLVLIIRNAFELSMNARVHQFGIFASIGATPGQIRACLLQEAAALCLLPILLGCALGIGISRVVLEAVNRFAADISGRHVAVFQYHPAVFALTFACAVGTVLLSAWIPARKLSRMTPLEAIRSESEPRLARRKRSRALGLLFGIEGELAVNALTARKKAMRISTVSLLLSFLGFTVMLCFFTLADISTRYTYFERYQYAWDVVADVKNTDLSSFARTEAVKRVEDAKDCILYQKANTNCDVPLECQSEDLRALGGWAALSGVSEDATRVSSPIVILDDESFLAYCTDIGATPDLHKAIVLNRIWDSAHSNFREKAYVPFLDKRITSLTMYAANGEAAEVSVLAYTDVPPALREEYAEYALTQFWPLTLWEHLNLGGAERNLYIRILARDREDAAQLAQIERSLAEALDGKYDAACENRIQERTANDDVLAGYQLLLGAFCALLGVIGIANVFFNTLGFLRQRRREFARYLSLGMTPADMRKMFRVEAFVIAGRPIAITLPLTAAAVSLMISASHLEASVFWREAPVVPVAAFALLIVGFVALAYTIGGRRIRACDLSEALKNDAEQ